MDFDEDSLIVLNVSLAIVGVNSVFIFGTFLYYLCQSNQDISMKGYKTHCCRFKKANSPRKVDSRDHLEAFILRARIDSDNSFV